jgi:hypothetical protein
MTGTFQFVPHYQIAERQAEGWVIADDLADCHHGRHSVLMRLPEDGDEDEVADE